MSVRLREIVFQVRCTEPGCPFSADFSVKENIMGATEADVDSEAWKIAKNQAYTRHDSIYGRRHALTNPEIRKVTSRYDSLATGVTAAAEAPAPPHPGSVPTRSFAKGERIVNKGETATTVCEVVRGSTCNEKRPEVTYREGSVFGAAALLQNKSRLADIVACEDDTVVAFYNLKELTRTNPSKARELFNAAMEDMFHVIVYLDEYSASLEKQVAKLRSAPAGRAAKAKRLPKKSGAKKAVKAVKKAAKKGKPAKKPPARKPAKTVKSARAAKRSVKKR